MGQGEVDVISNQFGFTGAISWERASSIIGKDIKIDKI